MASGVAHRGGARALASSRVAIALVLLLAACAGELPETPDDVLPFDEADPGALLDGPDCDSADVCLPGQVRRQCFAASRERSFAFETYQTFDVPRPGAYSFVRFTARRAFGAVPGGDLRIQLREFAPGGPWTPEAATPIATTTIAGAAIPGTDASLVARFASPVTLGLPNGSHRRYVLVFDVPTGRLTVGLGCTALAGTYPDGVAGMRRIDHPATNPSPRVWSTSARDVGFAIGFTANTAACPPTVPVPQCDDGNTTAGDGCSAACAIESGWACSGLPSTCADLDECALGTATCAAGATCTNTIGAWTCACPPGASGSGTGTACTGAGGHDGLSLASGGGTLRSSTYTLQLGVGDVHAAPIKASSPNYQLRGGFVGATGDLP